MDPHVIFEDYGILLTDLSSVSSGSFSTATELADLDELAQFMASSSACRADATMVASALGMLRPERITPVLANILEKTSPNIANLVIDIIDDSIKPTTLVKPPPHVTPMDSSGNLIVTAAQAIVEVIDDLGELVAITTKAKENPTLQRALIDLAPSIAGLIPQDIS